MKAKIRSFKRQKLIKRSTRQFMNLEDMPISQTSVLVQVLPGGSCSLSYHPALCVHLKAHQISSIINKTKNTVS